MLSEKWELRVLSSFITDLHNSNKPLVQVTLSGEFLPEERFHLLGFVGAEVVRLGKDVWFAVLDAGQIYSLNQYLSSCKKF